MDWGRDMWYDGKGNWIKKMKNSFFNIFLLIITIVLALLSAYYVGTLYDTLFPHQLGGGFWGSRELDRFLAGFFGSFLFFLISIFLAFCNASKKVWILSFGIPALLLIIILDFFIPHLLFHLSFPLLGWLIGMGVRRL